MKKQIERSPGRQPKKGKQQPGLIARTLIKFETPEELKNYLEETTAGPDHRPRWDQMLATFEAHARQFSQHELMQGELTPEGKASEVLWWADAVRKATLRSDPAANVAFAAMRLAGTLAELVVLANEPSLLVGEDQRGRPAQTPEMRRNSNNEHGRWQTMAATLRADPRHAEKSKTELAALIKTRLGLSQAVRTIRERIC